MAHVYAGYCTDTERILYIHVLTCRERFKDKIPSCDLCLYEGKV